MEEALASSEPGDFRWAASRTNQHSLHEWSLESVPQSQFPHLSGGSGCSVHL